jgi:hypothetical protein
MISVGSQARFATPFKSFFLTKIAAPIGLAAFLCWAAPGTAMSQPVSPAVSPGPATCRTPAVEARIQELRKEVADREQDDEGAQKVVTSYALKGASPNPVYKRYYDFLQESLRLRQELAQLEGLPPCPQPVAATPITSAGQYNSPFNDRSGYTGYRPFYYTPGYTPAPPAYNTPAYTSYPSYYNSPFYNAPVAPPPPVIGYSPFYNTPVYNTVGGWRVLFRPDGQRLVLAGFGPDQANRTADDGQLVVDAPLDNRHLNQLGQQLRFFAVRLRQLARPERGRQQDQSAELQHWL